MTSTPFTFNGQPYAIDDQGTISEFVGGKWQPVSTQDQGNVALQQAAVQAQSGSNQGTTTSQPSSDATQPNSTIPATPPRAGVGTTVTNFQATPGSTGSPGNPPPSPTLGPNAPPPPTSTPSTPPRSGVGSAVDLRRQRDAVQKQIDDLQAQINQGNGGSGTPGVPSAQEATLLNGYTGRVTSITEAIQKAEAPKEAAPKTVRQSYASESEPFTIIDNGDGTITPLPNPNYTGQVRPQVVQHGNQTLVITPPTSDEIQADPKAPPHVTVAFTDTDAKEIADRQTAVAEANAKTSAAAQATSDFAAHAKADLDARVSAGEDAASVRAEQALQLQKLYQNWQMADGDRKAAQTALDSYNANRHNTILEQQGQQALDNNAKAQAAQNAATLRGQDITASTNIYNTQQQAASSKYATDVGARTAKLQAGVTMLNNSLQLLSSINDKLPPGSDLAGKALPGLLAYGQKFLDGLAGSDVQMGNVQAPNLPAASTSATDAAPVNGVIQTPGSQNITDTTAAPDNTTPPPSTTTPTDQPTGPSGGLDWLFNSPASPVANPANTQSDTSTPPPDLTAPGAAAQSTQTQQMADQNTQQHQQDMRTQIFGPSTNDGTPLATAADVARMFGRAA